MIAALFVETGGEYFGLPDVDPWDKPRDARLYEGPHAVVAHPPCERWSQLARMVQARHGHKIGDDAGCFEAALESVRKFGGVLEHPAFSYAWRAFDLLEPPERGGWVGDLLGGWTSYVEQGRYGAPCRKGTWLYAFGVPALPSLKWGYGFSGDAVVSGWCKREGDTRPRLYHGDSADTPTEFRDVLLEMARSVGRAELCSECGAEVSSGPHRRKCSQGRAAQLRRRGGQ